MCEEIATENVVKKLRSLHHIIMGVNEMLDCRRDADYKIRPPEESLCVRTILATNGHLLESA